MNPKIFINDFLDRIRKKWISIQIINGIYLFFGILTGGLFAANLTAYFANDPKKYLSPFLPVLLITLAYILIRYLVQPIFSGCSREDAALLAEAQISGLNNALINGYQLQKYLDKPNAEKAVSLDFIRKLLDETRNKIQNIPIKDLNQLNQEQESSKHRNWFLASLGMMLFAGLILPEFFTTGYQKWKLPSPRPEPVFMGTTPPQTKTENASATPVSISDIRLKFNYPAYTQIPSKTVNPSDGKINVLSGTEVQITARASAFLSNADLIVNDKDRIAMVVDQGANLSGSLIVNEKGFYQFGIRTEAGHRDVLVPKYPILLEKDNSPRIILFLANPKPVYHENDKIQFYYEGHDDFGIQTIDLVINVNEKLIRKRIKTLRSREIEIKDGYIWNLSQMILRPGDRAEYYLEIKDNDNVQGPNSGQSETYSFKVFDPRQELENLVALQDELVDRMIILLSDSLVEHKVILTRSLENPAEIKKTLAVSSDKSIEIIHLIQNISDQAQPIQMFAPSYLTFFKNLITGLTGIRKEQIQLMKKLDSSTGNSVPVGYNFPPIRPLNEKLIGHLERAILLLVNITNRQKMDRVLDLEGQLRELTESIREEVYKAKSENIPPSVDGMRQRIKKTQHLVDKMLEQLSRQTRGFPDEFLNPNAFKQLNLGSFKASLDKILDLVNKGNMDEAINALNEMMQELQTLANQLDQAMSALDEIIDIETMKQIDQSLQELLKLEKEQKNLLNQTTKINQRLREAQVNKFESQLKDFFKSLKKDVQAAQKLLQQTDQFLKDDPQLKKYNNILDQEVKLKKAIQKPRQKMVDSVKKPDISEKFLDIRELSKQLANIINQKHELHLEIYEDFKNNLPGIKEKYDNLEELAELFDIREFNSLFKGTYPLAFRWQHKLRMIPLPSPDLSNKLQEDLDDLRKINAEISKKLGSMLRQLEKEYNSLISEMDRSKLRDMAQMQNEIRMKAENLEHKITKMSQKNPMIDPKIGPKMSSAGRYMKMAENNLNKPDVPHSIDTENGALEKMAETRNMLNELKNTNQENSNSRPQPIPKFGTGPSRDPRRGGLVRMERKHMNLPSEDQYKGPMGFRAEILDAMKGQHPKKYERFISEYYRELVK